MSSWWSLESREGGPYQRYFLYISADFSPHFVVSQATPLDLTEASPLDVFVHRLEDGTLELPKMVDGGGRIRTQQEGMEEYPKHSIWAIYNDLSRGHPKWWLSKGIHPKMALN